jgi:hypothetical protein
MNALEVRPATLDDVRYYFPDNLMPTFKAWAGVLNGKVVGIGGYAFKDGRWVAFCDMKAEAMKFKRKIVEAGKTAMRAADEQNITLFAWADTGIPGSSNWLRHLGFVETGPLHRRVPNG